MKLSFFIIIFLLGLVISDARNLQGKSWCVVAVGAPENKLASFVDAKCAELNCKEVKSGGSCYQPNTLQNHASYVLNLYYRAHGVCESGFGLLSVNDPSFGRCHYT